MTNSTDQISLIDRQWGQDRRPAVDWNSLKRQTQRIGKITGDPHSGSWGYLFNKYVGRGRQIQSVLSACCGTGWLEPWINEYCEPQRIDAFDVSPSAIEQARTARVEKKIVYFVKDGNELKLNRKYDLIVISGGMHHILKLEQFCTELRDHLTDEGVLIASEYVGPRYTQYTPRQVQLINACINLLPMQYRARPSGQYWTEYKNMTVEDWIKHDPSESVRSDEIMSVVNSTFSRVESIDRGRSLLHFALFDIAQNFNEDDPTDARWLDILFQIEDAAIAAGEVPMCWVDFAARR